MSYCGRQNEKVKMKKRVQLKKAKYKSDFIKSPSTRSPIGKGSVIKSPIGERSLRTKVHEGLRFTITDFLDSTQLQVMIKTWSSFTQLNGNLSENPDIVDQSTYIQAFIETNLTTRASVGQKFLFGKLKDLPRHSRPYSLEKAFEFVISEFREIRRACQTAYSVGYRMSTSYHDSHVNNTNKKPNPPKVVSNTPQSSVKN